MTGREANGKQPPVNTNELATSSLACNCVSSPPQSHIYCPPFTHTFLFITPDHLLSSLPPPPLPLFPLFSLLSVLSLLSPSCLSPRLSLPLSLSPPVSLYLPLPLPRLSPPRLPPLSPSVPLVSKVCPSDVYRVWKSGSCLRVDTTLLGFEHMTWLKGRRSYIFKGGGTTPGGRAGPWASGRVGDRALGGRRLGPLPAELGPGFI